MVKQAGPFGQLTEGVFAHMPPQVNKKPPILRLLTGIDPRLWRDVLGVLKTRAGELDQAYLREWAGELQVADLLERALREAS